MRRVSVVGILIAATSALTYSQQKYPRTNPGTRCGTESTIRNDDDYGEYYRRAVYDYFQPPDWGKAKIRIALRGETELRLWTDGKRFQIWTYITTPRNINRYLDDLSDACRLPANPSDAARLIKIKTETADVSESQFAQIHKGLILATSQYLSSAQQRYGKLRDHLYLDATVDRVLYDNTYEHIEVTVIDDPNEFGPMVDWIRELRQLAENSFHHPLP
jgi:hypothetical protein